MFTRFAIVSLVSAASVLALAGSASAQQAQARDSVYIQANGRQFQITNAKVTSVSSGSFFANTAVVGPGATITLEGDYTILPSNNPADFFCSGCILQSYIAWSGPATVAGASPFNIGLWNGSSSGPGSLFPTNTAQGHFVFTSTAPTTPGFYTVSAGESLQFGFVPNVAGAPGWDLSIGVIGNPTFGAFLISVVNEPTAPCAGDANGDGTVNFSDVGSILANFNTTCP